MKTIIALVLLGGSVALFNTGCTASASIKKTSDAARVNDKAQIAYVTASSGVQAK